MIQGGAKPIAVVKWSSTEVSVGDAIQFWHPGDNRWGHTAMVTSFDYGLTYGGHTTNARRKPLSDVYPHGYTEVRFICPLNAVD